MEPEDTGHGPRHPMAKASKQRKGGGGVVLWISKVSYRECGSVSISLLYSSKSVEYLTGSVNLSRMLLFFRAYTYFREPSLVV